MRAFGKKGCTKGRVLDEVGDSQGKQRYKISPDQIHQVPALNEVTEIVI